MSTSAPVERVNRHHWIRAFYWLKWGPVPARVFFSLAWLARSNERWEHVRLNGVQWRVAATVRGARLTNRFCLPSCEDPLNNFGQGAPTPGGAVLRCPLGGQWRRGLGARWENARTLKKMRESENSVRWGRVDGGMRTNGGGANNSSAVRRHCFSRPRDNIDAWRPDATRPRNLTAVAWRFNPFSLRFFQVFPYRDLFYRNSPSSHDKSAEISHSEFSKTLSPTVVIFCDSSFIFLHRMYFI